MDMVSAVVWANGEFSGAQLGDARRCNRAARVAAGLLCNVGVAVSSSCGGSGAQAVSRFFDSDDVNEDSVLSGHKLRIGERCKHHDGRILVVQDTTALEFPGRSNIEGLGPTAVNGGNGIMMHSTFVMSEQKLPLGVLGLRLWCRDPHERGINHTRKKRNTLEKESAKWLWGLGEVNKHLSRLGKELVLIGDRESDLYDLFASTRPDDVHLIARISQNRVVNLDDERVKIFDALNLSPVLGEYELELEREKRTARLQVRRCRVLMSAPKGYKRINSGSVWVWVVEIREVDAPDGVECLHWRLLSSLDASSLELCRYIAECYRARWSIEEFHRTLKTGCRVERMQLESVSRLRPAIAMMCVVAVQVMYLTRFARSHPDAPVYNVANKEEAETVESWVQTNRYKTYEVTTVSDYVRGIGFIGGFRGRKCDGEPGVQAIWQGLRSLANLVSGRKIERLKAART